MQLLFQNNITIPVQFQITLFQLYDLEHVSDKLWKWVITNTPNYF